MFMLNGMLTVPVMLQCNPSPSLPQPQPLESSHSAATITLAAAAAAAAIPLADKHGHPNKLLELPHPEFRVQSLL